MVFVKGKFSQNNSRFLDNIIFSKLNFRISIISIGFLLHICTSSVDAIWNLGFPMDFGLSCARTKHRRWLSETSNEKVDHQWLMREYISLEEAAKWDVWKCIITVENSVLYSVDCGWPNRSDVGLHLHRLNAIMGMSKHPSIESRCVRKSK